MHICIDARMIRSSGIGVYLQNLIPYLIERQQVSLIGDKDQLIEYRATIIHCNIPIYSTAELLEFPKIIPACDIFWSPHYNVPVLSHSAKKKLVTIHDVFHLAFFKTLSLKQKIYAKVLLNAAVYLSDQVITVSQFSKNEIVKLTVAKPDKIQVILNGVNHDLFHPIKDLSLQQEVISKYDLPDQFLLFVGNVKPHKNLINLIKAFKMVRQENDSIKLVIVGKKEGFITGDNELVEMIEGDPVLKEVITFTGFVQDQDLPVMYSLAKLFVFPSLYEGFGLPPLEAMACGCMTLVSHKASMPEVCNDATIYINPEDPASIAENIKNTLSLPESQKTELINSGIEQSKKFQWRAAIQQHIDILERLHND